MTLDRVWLDKNTLEVYAAQHGDRNRIPYILEAELRELRQSLREIKEDRHEWMVASRRAHKTAEDRFAELTRLREALEAADRLDDAVCLRVVNPTAANDMRLAEAQNAYRTLRRRGGRRGTMIPGQPIEWEEPERGKPCPVCSDGTGPPFFTGTPCVYGECPARFQ